MKVIRQIILVCLVFLFFSVSFADVKLASILGSNMVLQRNTRVKIWGWADPGEEIRVGPSWQSFPVKPVKADKDGKWEIFVQTLYEAYGPHQIVISGKNTIILKNILFGEVWVASGQSNMEMPLTKVSAAYTGIKDYEKEIAAANYPQIRLFQVGNFSSKEPLDDIGPGISMYGVPESDSKWKACTPETIPTFASTAYFFARHLHKELGVPVGIIDSSWGGTRAEAWTPAEGLKKLGYANELKLANEALQQPRQKIPTRLYNGMIHPLHNLSIKGVIWYQGEGNCSRANKYQELFTTMITSWRKTWGLGDFPFYYAQISPYQYRNNKSEELREAQMKTLSLKNTGMAVTMDIADLKDIHPKNKQQVGRRLALWALAKDYGKKDVVYSGPIYESMKVEGDKIRIRFDYTGSGLKTNDGKEVSHLQIAGADKNFVESKGVIEGDTLVVSSETVKKPVAVRYGWSNMAQPNLSNKEGLPASSFRTDNWSSPPAQTQKKNSNM